MINGPILYSSLPLSPDSLITKLNKDYIKKLWPFYFILPCMEFSLFVDKVLFRVAMQILVANSARRSLLNSINTKGFIAGFKIIKSHVTLERVKDTLHMPRYVQNDAYSDNDQQKRKIVITAIITLTEDLFDRLRWNILRNFLLMLLLSLLTLRLDEGLSDNG